ncbi:MAG: hypothetical protein ACKPCM_01445 [Pseudanabaena sp.]
MKTAIPSIKPDRLFPTSNSDRPSPSTKPDRLNPHINQRSPLHVSDRRLK